MMHDNLRKIGLLPTTSPYHPNEKTLAITFEKNNNDAVVDWLKIELLDPVTLI